MLLLWGPQKPTETLSPAQRAQYASEAFRTKLASLLLGQLWWQPGLLSKLHAALCIFMGRWLSAARIAAGGAEQVRHFADLVY